MVYDASLTICWSWTAVNNRIDATAAVATYLYFPSVFKNTDKTNATLKDCSAAKNVRNADRRSFILSGEYQNNANASSPDFLLSAVLPYNVITWKIITVRKDVAILMAETNENTTMAVFSIRFIQEPHLPFSVVLVNS